jgi:hypothetical protein
MILLSDRVCPQILFIEERPNVRVIPEDGTDLLPEVFDETSIHV